MQQAMHQLPAISRIGVVGSGTMGRGIAQTAALAGVMALLVDVEDARAQKAIEAIGDDLDKLAAKGKLSPEAVQAARERLKAGTAADLDGMDLVVEAVFEDLGVKQQLFRELEFVCGPDTVLATNTSALSVTALAGACRQPERVVGLHFFNPVPRMALVEVVSAARTAPDVADRAFAFASQLGKTPIRAKDTPGFVVNRVARPYYLEALEIVGAGEATAAEVDAAMRAAGFKMGPFELMDFIGIDVNFAVSCAVHDAFFGEPRFRPHPLQRQLSDAGKLGRKTGAGFYSYDGARRLEPDVTPPPASGPLAGLSPLASRILAMIVNEAYFALGEGVASEADIDLAMKLGTAYPEGPLAWARKLGPAAVARTLDDLWQLHHRERYRLAPALRRSSREG